MTSDTNPIVTISVVELADCLKATIDGDPTTIITGPAEWQTGGADKIGFIENFKHVDELTDSTLGIILAPMEGDIPGDRVVLRVPDPKRAFAKVLGMLLPEPTPKPGVHPTAIVPDGVVVPESVSIGPYSVICDGVTFSDGVIIGAECHVGDDSVLGKNTRLFTNVTLYHRVTLGERCRIHSGTVIGADGFSYFYRKPDGHVKFPQVGGVVIGNDVEIGSNTCIDSGSFEPTTIADGTKIDNSVQIGHNDRIGPMNLICGNSGLAGNVKTGVGVIISGMVGVGDHMTLHDGVIVAAKSGVFGDIAPGETVMGYPARPRKEWLRSTARISKLDDMHKRIKTLEKRLSELESGAQTEEP